MRLGASRLQGSESGSATNLKLAVDAEGQDARLSKSRQLLVTSVARSAGPAVTCGYLGRLHPRFSGRKSTHTAQVDRSIDRGMEMVIGLVVETKRRMEPQIQRHRDRDRDGDVDIDTDMHGHER